MISDQGKVLATPFVWCSAGDLLDNEAVLHPAGALSYSLEPKIRSLTIPAVAQVAKENLRRKRLHNIFRMPSLNHWATGKDGSTDFNINSRKHPVFYIYHLFFNTPSVSFSVNRNQYNVLCSQHNKQMPKVRTRTI